jgi:hypothetical protein
MFAYALIAGFALGNPAAVQAEESILGTIVVEEKLPDPYADFDAWEHNMLDALARAQLKYRDQLTDEDRAQILILQSDMPVLKQSIGTMNRLINKHRFRRTLSTSDQLALVRAYAKAEAILENVPDAFLPRCRLLNREGQRNRTPVCEHDYAAMQHLLDDLERRHGKPAIKQDEP